MSTLSYGVNQRNRRRILFRALLALFVIAALLTSLIFGKEFVRKRFVYGDRDSIEAMLQAIPGASAVYLDGYDDGPLAWDLASASFRLDNGRPRFIKLGPQTNADDLRTGKHIRVECLGYYQLHLNITDRSDTEIGYTFDFGRDGACANLLPFALKDVHDLAAHYDEIEAILSRMPRTGTHKTPGGREFHYDIFDNNSLTPR